ncbi:MAG: hypothetical protein OEW42_02725 [Acidimicrobiia bacterium]|nr:hypothetical protein [Acidimicrobiia bacterium]
MTQKQRLIAALLLGAGAACFLVLFWFYNDPGDTSDISIERNLAVEQLFPARGAAAFQQQEVGVDLASGFQGSLVIDGVAIPAAQTHGIAELNQVLFRPDDGQVIEQLPAGEVCATATYQSIEDPTDVGIIDWCFVVN